MGLAGGYGMLVGTLVSVERDDPNNFGRFMHGVLTVGTPAGTYRCAVDVDTRNGQIPVQWRIQPLRIAEWAGLLALPDGWHPLASNAYSGAVDYIRDPRVRDMFYLPDIPELVAGPRRRPFPPEELLARLLPHRAPIEAAVRGDAARPDALHLRAPVKRRFEERAASLRLRKFSGKVVMTIPPWNSGSSDQALTDLEAVLSAPHRVMVFGAPFQVGRGVHDIHQNQGDPPGGGHDGENAIWQDGITIAIRQDGTAVAFMNKFSTQADCTDDNGHPLP